MQEMKILPLAHPWIRPVELESQKSFGFWDTNWSPDIAQTTRPRDSQQKKKKKKKERTSLIVEWAVSGDHWVKFKEKYSLRIF